MVCVIGAAQSMSMATPTILTSYATTANLSTGVTSMGVTSTGATGHVRVGGTSGRVLGEVKADRNVDLGVLLGGTLGGIAGILEFISGGSGVVFVASGFALGGFGSRVGTIGFTASAHG